MSSLLSSTTRPRRRPSPACGWTPKARRWPRVSSSTHRGVELANGYHELLDADEQEARFATDLRERERLGLPAIPVDTRFLAALRHGLPDCSGVALGLDRLVMLAVGAASLQEVVAFPVEPKAPD
jgi:elongation factor P--beta-lysine ligase